MHLSLTRFYNLFMRCCISNLITGKSFVCMWVCCNKEVFPCYLENEVRFDFPCLDGPIAVVPNRWQPFDFRARGFDFARRLTANETTAA